MQCHNHGCMPYLYIADFIFRLDLDVHCCHFYSDFVSRVCMIYKYISLVACAIYSGEFEIALMFFCHLDPRFHNDLWISMCSVEVYIRTFSFIYVLCHVSIFLSYMQYSFCTSIYCIFCIYSFMYRF